MKSKVALALLALPVGFAGYVAFHPGVAFAASSLSRSVPPTAFSQAGTYTVDPVHTGVGFDVDHLGISRVQGRFTKVAGSIHANPSNLDASSVTFTIQTDSVDTAVEMRDADLRSPNFFDVAKFPEIRFKSTKIEKHGKGYIAIGDLTLHGVTKSVKIPFKQFGPITDPWKATRIGIVADPIVIDREDYGMHFDVPLVGSKVNVRLSLEATLDK